MSAPAINRAEAARQWIARQRTPKSAREFLNALQPKGEISRWSATLAQLAKAGQLVRHGSGQGCRFSAPLPGTRRACKRKQEPTGLYAAQRHPKPKPESQIRIAPARPALDAPAAPRRVEPETVEEFLRRGGRIQRLEPHEVSQPLRFEYQPTSPSPAPHVPRPRRKRAATPSQ